MSSEAVSTTPQLVRRRQLQPCGDNLHAIRHCMRQRRRTHPDGSAPETNFRPAPSLREAHSRSTWMLPTAMLDAQRRVAKQMNVHRAIRSLVIACDVMYATRRGSLEASSSRGMRRILSAAYLCPSRPHCGSEAPRSCAYTPFYSQTACLAACFHLAPILTTIKSLLLSSYTLFSTLSQHHPSTSVSACIYTQLGTSARSIA